MALSMAQLERDPAFERFLGATVREDSHGTNVTVLSMLAMLDLDPWDEASDLAAMPDGPARKRLNVLLARFKDVPMLISDRSKIISGLLGRLPRKRAPAKAIFKGTSAKLPVPKIGIPIYWIIAAALILGWIFNLAQAQCDVHPHD